MRVPIGRESTSHSLHANNAPTYLSTDYRPLPYVCRGEATPVQLVPIYVTSTEIGYTNTSSHPAMEILYNISMVRGSMCLDHRTMGEIILGMILTSGRAPCSRESDLSYLKIERRWWSGSVNGAQKACFRWSPQSRHDWARMVDDKAVWSYTIHGYGTGGPGCTEPSGPVRLRIHSHGPSIWSAVVYQTGRGHGRGSSIIIEGGRL